MAKLKIEQNHELEPAEAKRRLTELQARLAQKYGIEGKWVSDSEAHIARTGAKGTIKNEPGRVTVELDLNFLLSPMKEKIENRVRQELVTALAGEHDGAKA